MKLQVGYSYHIKDDFFYLVHDTYLMANKEQGGYRPHYYAIKDSKYSELYWMIPISSQYSKYKRIYEKKIEKFGTCDTILLGKFGGKQCVFLIQNAFPIKEEYVDHVHTIQNKPITVHKELSKKLQSQLKTCLALHKKGKKVFFTNIDNILVQLNY